MPRDVDEKSLGREVAVKGRSLGAFLVVQHDLQRDSRAAGPARMRRALAITDEIARIGGGGRMFLVLP